MAMDLKVADGWAVPPQQFQVQRYKPQSAVPDSEYKLTLYERIIQVSAIFGVTYHFF